MNLSNYPPGVTGNEFEIAGPDKEWEIERECPVCAETGTGGDPSGATGEEPQEIHPIEAWSYGNNLHWVCPDCGSEFDEELDNKWSDR